MRLSRLTIFMLLAGILVPVYQAKAVVITSADKWKSNYKIHHRIIIYDDLSSYQNTRNRQINNRQGLISLQFSSGNFFDDNVRVSKILPNIENTKLAQLPNNTSSLGPTYSLTSITQSNLIFGNKQADDYQEIPVGSSLESFKTDPLLQIIYFTSKDLMFNYKKKITNMLQLEFDMKSAGHRNNTGPWRNRQLEKEKPFTQYEQKILKQETKILFGFMTESYKVIVFVFIGMIGALFISFRYILNRYI